MQEINEREGELRAARDKLIEQEEENRTLSVGSEKLKNENTFLVTELRKLTQQYEDLKIKLNDKSRLLQSVSNHSKNQAISGLKNIN